MEDGLADRGPIWEDIARVTADQLGDITGFLAGFPCQARPATVLRFQRFQTFSRVFGFPACRISAEQAIKLQCRGPGPYSSKKSFGFGMRRTSLVIQWTLNPIFELFYLSIVFYLNIEHICASSKHLRKFMVLENVGQLLSLKCRDCMNYICQAPALGRYCK